MEAAQQQEATKPNHVYTETADYDLKGKEGYTAAEDVVVPEYDAHETRKILWKIDYRLVPFLSVLYLASFLNVTNLGNAEIAGMQQDLNLYGNRYNVALSVFFVTYSLFEIPANIVLKIIRPSWWIGIQMFVWGTIMTLTGITQSYQGLVVCRFFLGLAEAGFFPCAAYLLTIWYKRYEVQRRMAVFYAACSLSGAFGGLLAFAIEKMDGVGGLAGWRWIFIIEGLFPVVCSVFTFFYLPDSPETAKFLTPAERDFVVKRLYVETGTTNSDKITWRLIKEALMDKKIYVMMIIYQGVSIGVYGFTSVVPIVINNMGYESANAQLLTIPVYVAAVINVFIVAWWSDKLQERSYFIMGAYSLAIIGFIAQLALPQTRLYGVTYFFLFLIAMGLYGPFVSIMCLCMNNLAPSSKRAVVGTALLVTVGNFGGFVGTNIFLESESPHYPVGFGVCLGVLVTSTTAAFFLRRSLKKENERRDAFMVGKTVEDIKAQYGEQELINMGDKSPLFRYTL